MVPASLALAVAPALTTQRTQMPTVPLDAMLPSERPAPLEVGVEKEPLDGAAVSLDDASSAMLISLSVPGVMLEIQPLTLCQVS